MKQFSSIIISPWFEFSTCFLIRQCLVSDALWKSILRISYLRVFPILRLYSYKIKSLEWFIWDLLSLHTVIFQKLRDITSFFIIFHLFFIFVFNNSKIQIIKTYIHTFHLSLSLWKFHQKWYFFKNFTDTFCIFCKTLFFKLKGNIFCLLYLFRHNM